MTDSAAASGRRRKTAILIALVISVSLNVGFAAFIAARVWAAPVQPVILRTPQQLFDLLDEKLPPADAVILRDILATRSADLEAAREARQRARVNIIMALVRPDFDAGAFRAAMKEVRAARGRVADVTLDVIEETVVKISPQTRKELVARFRSRFRER